MSNDEPDMGDLIRRIDSGDRDAFDIFISQAEQDLRRIAKGMVKPHDRRHDAPTSIVQEYCIRLMGNVRFSQFKDMKHFWTYSAKAMRNILIDRAERRRAEKRGGGIDSEPLDMALDQYIDRFNAQNQFDFLCVCEAITRLPREDQILVEYYYFTGMNYTEIARIVGGSAHSVSAKIGRILTDLTELMEGQGHE